jgi:hypothetical protein
MVKGYAAGSSYNVAELKSSLIVQLEAVGNNLANRVLMAAALAVLSGFACCIAAQFTTTARSWCSCNMPQLGSCGCPVQQAGQAA